MTTVTRRLPRSGRAPGPRGARWLPAFYLAPSLALFAVFIAYPFLRAIWFSFNETSFLGGIIGGSRMSLAAFAGGGSQWTFTNGEITQPATRLLQGNQLKVQLVDQFGNDASECTVDGTAVDHITFSSSAADGRFGTAAFVTGGLDPVTHREDFLALFGPDLPPVLVLHPEGAPRRSGAEMDALAGSGLVTARPVPGALSAHEEHPAAIAAAIRAA